LLLAAFDDSSSFDPVSLLKDGVAAPEIDVSGRKVALVMAVVIVVGDKGGDAPFEIAGQKYVLDQDASLVRSNAPRRAHLTSAARNERGECREAG
jgi:hypothetical protein